MAYLLQPIAVSQRARRKSFDAQVSILTPRFLIRLYVKDAVATTVMTRIESSSVTSKFLSPSSRCRGPDLQPNPDGQDDQDDRGDHRRHGKRRSEAPHGCTSNRSALAAAVISFAAISPTLRLWKCASIASRPSRSCYSGSSMIRSRPRYCIHSSNFARCSGIVGSSLDCCGGRPLLGLGRRKLIPSREQVTCSEPSVTPIVSAICSRLKPRSTRFLICRSRSGVNLIGRPLAAVSGTADPSNIGTVPSCLAREASGSGVRLRLRSPSKGTIFAHDGALPDGSLARPRIWR